MTAGWAAWTPLQRYVGLAQPAQFYRAVDVPASTARRVVAVAHNAGDHPATITRAVRRGADVIEVDVIAAGGALVAGRPMRPWPWLAERVFQGSTLVDTWRAIPRGTAVLLDLKETDRALLDQLTAFLRPRIAGRDVLLSTRDAGCMRYLRARFPTATLLLTTAWPSDVARLDRSPRLAGVIDGVSAYEGLVDADFVARLHARSLQVVAWPVDDGARLRALARAGVDAVTTDNLAVLAALSSR